MKKSLFWFRRDLRLHNNPALSAAQERGEVIFVYIWAPRDESPWQPGAASRWWLHHSLTALKKSLEEKGHQLVLRSGSPQDLLFSLCEETGADGVFWNRLYDPALTQRDEQIKTALKQEGIHAQSFSAHLLCEPWELKTQQEKPYQVFTPFWNALQKRTIPKDTSRSVESQKPGRKIPSEDLSAWNLLPALPWDSDFKKLWKPGEAGAHQRWKHFLAEGLESYQTKRDFPSLSSTSSLSPHLHFGEISVVDLWHQVKELLKAKKIANKAERSSAEFFLRELAWRDFAHHILFHFPHTSNNPLQKKFEKFPWSKNATGLKTWQRGLTGYPIVDAGMRELWATGTMHNRVRMIVASFLTKDLVVSWLEGAKWFWDTLVDADLANNSLGWQWAGGCGADAAPYFRIFNPQLQSEKFDAEGSYIRRWIPELADLPTAWLHQPWAAPDAVLATAKVRLGKTYPLPLVNHSQARARALEAYAQVKVG